MIALVQKVNWANVFINQSKHSEIKKGILVFLGIANFDDEKDIDYIIRRIESLKFFQGVESNFAKNIKEEDAEILVVSQFTLYADLKKGTKPSFTKAKNPRDAKSLYEKFCDKLIKKGYKTKTGCFQEYMQISLENDGPVTFNLCSDHLHNATKI